MFKRFLQASSAETRFTEPTEEFNGSHNGLSVPANSERSQTDSPDTAKLASFDEIYHRSAVKASTSTTAWDILKVADMVNNGHLQGLSPSAKHSALMMALEAADVAVADMLQDAVQRHRVLNEYEEVQRRRLEDLAIAKQSDKERLAAEMEAICAQYRTRITGGEQEMERERGMFRDWQERKEREQRRISEAASACVSADSCGSSNYSISRLLEKNSGRLRESA
jgi:hypothetical protein